MEISLPDQTLLGALTPLWSERSGSDPRGFFHGQVSRSAWGLIFDSSCLPDSPISNMGLFAPAAEPHP